MQKQIVKAFLKIIDFYIFSNIHVALATFALVKITLLQLGISENTTPWFVFFSTLVSYNFIRFLRLNETSTWHKLWLENNIKMLYLISGLSLISILALSLQLRIKTLLLLFPFVLATFFYVSPIKKRSLRNIGGLKLFLIALSWASVTVLIPLTQNYITLRTTDWISFLQRFFFVIAITLPFDIRDVNYDSTNLKTIPQQLNLAKSKFFGILILLLFILLELVKPQTEQYIVSLLIIAIVAGLLLWKASKTQSKYYSALFVESLPILWYFGIII